MRNFVLATTTALFATTYVSAQNQDTTTYHLDNIVVTGTRTATDIRHLPMTVTVIGREKLTEQHQISVLPTAMQQVPSMFVTNRTLMGYGVSTGAAGGINMRGLSGGAGQLMVLIDGHPQYQGIYGHPISDSYQTMMAERVEVLRGPASVIYGSNAMGGVLNIVTRAMKNDGTITNLSLGGGSYGSFQGEVSNQVRKGRLSTTVAAQYSRSDNHRPRMGFQQYGGYMKVGYDITTNWNTYVDANITHFIAEYPGGTTAPIYGAKQWITRGMVSAALENHYEKTNGALSIYTNFGRHKIDDGSSNPETPTQRYFRSKDNLMGISWYQSAQLFQGNRITLGVDYQHIYGHAFYTSKETGNVIDTPNKQSGKSHRNEIATYAEIRQDVLDWLTVDAGIRFDHHSVSGTEWVPQAGVVVRPIATGEIKMMASKGFRNPTMREMYLYPPSNEELRAERIWNYELSWRHRIVGLTYGVNVFYINGDNMIQTIERKNVNTGKIENCGLEMEASYRINKHWNIFTNHSLLHMVHPVISAPKYKASLGAEMHSGRWTAGTSLQYINNLYTSVPTAENNGTKETFCLLNANLGYNITKGLQLWIRGENLMAQKYETVLGYPMPRATFMAGVDWKF